MGTYVTSTGFNKKSFATIKAEQEAVLKAAFGDDIDLEPDSPFGQIVAENTKTISDLWNGMEEIYTSRNPNEAEGISLDNICAETGIKRLDATKTVISNVLLEGDEGTLVAAGKQAKQTETSEAVYELSADVTITKASALKVKLEPDAPSPGGGETYTVTIDAVPYTYVASPGDTKADVINELVTLILAGYGANTASNEDDTYLVVDGLDSDSDSIPDQAYSIVWTSTLTLDYLASPGTFQALVSGPYTVPANSLVVINTPVVGWNSVLNPMAGVTGTDVETDAELRLRRAESFLSGNATDEAIKSKILANITGVQTATVTSNRTLAVDGSGRPAKSYEAVVQGGDEDEIAELLWQIQPSGIESYGTTSKTVQDSEGQNQTVKFSRPENVYVWIKVKRDLYSEEDYPTDGDTQIKTAIVNWGLELPPGKDLIRLRLSNPIYSINGIGNIEITLDYSTSIGHTPVYSEQDVPISVRQILNFDVSRITVEDLTP